VTGEAKRGTRAQRSAGATSSVKASGRARVTTVKIGARSGAPSSEEAAAIVAAIEALGDELARGIGEAEPPAEQWKSVALLEGVSGGITVELREPWIKT
jgi:hypothetical protein